MAIAVATSRTEDQVGKIEQVTPDMIAKLTQETLESAERTSKMLRGLGDYAARMGDQTKEALYGLATDFDEHAKQSAQSIVKFANEISGIALQAQELRKGLPTH